MILDPTERSSLNLAKSRAKRAWSVAVQRRHERRGCKPYWTSTSTISAACAAVIAALGTESCPAIVAVPQVIGSPSTSACLLDYFDASSQALRDARGAPDRMPNSRELFLRGYTRAMDIRAGDHAQFSVRIGDADRDDCLEALAEHHVRGRISVDELDRRQRLALVAETRADLAALLADLPRNTASSRVTALSGGMAAGRRLRSLRSARWVAAPLSLATGGGVVVFADARALENGFVTGVVAAALGYLGHVVAGKRAAKGR